MILRRFAPERALAGVLLLAWNPVVLVETIGHGHNDLAMMVWFLAATWALANRRFTLAILALVMGGLFKHRRVLMLPTAGLIALRARPDNRMRRRFVIVTGIAAVRWSLWPTRLLGRPGNVEHRTPPGAIDRFVTGCGVGHPTKAVGRRGGRGARQPGGGRADGSLRPMAGGPGGAD